MKRYITLLAQAGMVFCVSYVAPAIVATIITLDLSTYMSWIHGNIYTAVVGIFSFFATLCFVVFEMEKFENLS